MSAVRTRKLAVASFHWKITGRKTGIVCPEKMATSSLFKAWWRCSAETTHWVLWGWSRHDTYWKVIKKSNNSFYFLTLVSLKAPFSGQLILHHWKQLLLVTSSKHTHKSTRLFTYSSAPRIILGNLEVSAAGGLRAGKKHQVMDSWLQTWPLLNFCTWVSNKRIMLALEWNLLGL